jgi:uncharacterized membrane protein
LADDRAERAANRARSWDGAAGAPVSRSRFLLFGTADRLQRGLLSSEPSSFLSSSSLSLSFTSSAMSLSEFDSTPAAAREPTAACTLTGSGVGVASGSMSARESHGVCERFGRKFLRARAQREP